MVEIKFNQDRNSTGTLQIRKLWLSPLKLKLTHISNISLQNKSNHGPRGTNIAEMLGK